MFVLAKMPDLGLLVSSRLCRATALNSTSLNLHIFLLSNLGPLVMADLKLENARPDLAGSLEIFKHSLSKSLKACLAQRVCDLD